MKLPDLYLAPEKKQIIDLARYFIDGENKAYTCAVADEAVATATVSGTKLTVTGVATGITTMTVTVDGVEHVVTITVRNSANNNGWM